jgi:hypothetical protein
MGYYIEGEGYLKIKDEALFWKRVELLHSYENELGRGGSSSGEVWYSWMNDDCHLEYEKDRDIEGYFNAWGFKVVSYNPDEMELELSYDSKAGQEDWMLMAVAPAMVGTFNFRGEDGAQWMFTFNEDKPMVQRVSTPTWDQPEVLDFMEQAEESKRKGGAWA